MTSQRGRPPPLPPRQSGDGSESTPIEDPPPYELVAHQQRALEKATSTSNVPDTGMVRDDPRSSSQDSLSPQPGEQSGRRRLLLVYIHGFMGNETSFRSFPLHVHNLLATLLAETHVLHTKIYPRYRSRGNITIARDDFSKWLEPHERGSTDVVLLGHSMGGLLAAEVALMPAPRPASRPLKHCVLGTINFDVPFLGMHPGVVRSGLASIFKPSEETQEDHWNATQQQAASGAGTSQESVLATPPARSDTLWAPSNADPNYNPSFNNDVVLPVRKGWRSAWHFVNKHSDDLVQSTKKLISSHMEFGGAMAKYGELKNRYGRIRALEEQNEAVRKTVVGGGVPPRVRFINYYTASTGRPKKPSSSASSQRKASPSPGGSRSTSLVSASGTSHASKGTSTTTEPPKEEDYDRHDTQQLEDAMDTLKIKAPTPNTQGSERLTGKPHSSSGLLTRPPPLGDLSYIQDPKIRELVEQHHQKAVEAYERANADRPTTEESSTSKGKQKQPQMPASPLPKPPSEMSHQERENLRLEKERQRMEAEGRRMRGEKDPDPERPLDAVQTSQSTATSASAGAASSVAAPPTIGSVMADESGVLTPQSTREESGADAKKRKKDRNFCVLPPKDANGERDPCWVRVFMENVDEVGAHCGLFFIDEKYERLVGDVAERVEQWVKDRPGQQLESTTMKS